LGLWRLKTGRDEQPEPSALMRAGIHMEPFILREYEATGAILRLGHARPDRVEVWAQETGLHPAHPWAGATVDSFAERDGEYLIVDAKMSRRVIDPADPETIPWEWSLQLHHYAWICDLPRAELAVCQTGAGFEVIAVQVPIDLDWYVADVVPRLREFWSCVEQDREPPLPTPVERNPPPDLGQLAAMYAADAEAAAEREKRAGADKDRARGDLRRILEAAGYPRRSVAGEFSFSTWRVEGRETIDGDGLRAAHPEIAETYTKRGEPRIDFRITKRRAP
jgi:hypothetical protein